MAQKLDDDCRHTASAIQIKVLASSFTGWLFDGFETSALILVGGTAASALIGDASSDVIRVAVGEALSATLLGWAFGGIMGSALSDTLGRRRMLLISMVGYCALSALTALSGSIAQLIVFRFLTGIFLGSEWSTGTALIAETWPASARAKALGIMQSGYGFGFLLAACCWLLLQSSLGPDAWRWMFAVGVFPAIILLLFRRAVPESELWLEAVSGDSPKGSFLREPLLRSVTDFLKDRDALARALPLLIMACVTVAVFYGVTALSGPFIKSVADQAGQSRHDWVSISAIVYNMGSILGYIAGGVLADRLGRKPYMRLMFLGAIAVGLLIFVSPVSLPLALLEDLLLGIFTLGVFSWMPIYLPELFPTKIRSTASGFIFNLARLIATPVPAGAAIMFATIGGYKHTVLALVLLYVVALAALAFLPETKGRPLPR